VAVEAARAAGDGELEDGLCEIDPNQSIVHVDSSFYAVTSSDFGTSMPIKSQEESIPSMHLTSARCPRRRALAGDLGVRRT
jgi:hypothetical protein